MTDRMKRLRKFLTELMLMVATVDNTPYSLADLAGEALEALDSSERDSAKPIVLAAIEENLRLGLLQLSDGEGKNARIWHETPEESLRLLSKEWDDLCLHSGDFSQEWTKWPTVIDVTPAGENVANYLLANGWTEPKEFSAE